MPLGEKEDKEMIELFNTFDVGTLANCVGDSFSFAITPVMDGTILVDALGDDGGPFAKLTEKLRTSFIGPAFLLIVAGIALLMGIQRKMRELITAIAVFIIAGVLIYGPALIKNTTTSIGSENTNLWSGGGGGEG